VTGEEKKLLNYKKEIYKSRQNLAAVTGECHNKKIAYENKSIV